MYRIVKGTMFNQRNLNTTKFQYRMISKNETALIVGRNIPKRGFSFQNFGFGLSPVIKMILGAQALIYFIGFPMDMNRYVRSFFYNKDYAASNGKFQTILTCHFAKAGLFDLVIDSVLVGMFGSSILMMGGELLLKKIVCFSVLFSSLILMFGNKSDNNFYKSDALLRGLLFYLIAQNPNTSFLLFPFPFQIKALYIGIAIVALDLYIKKPCNFGGIIAGIALARGLL